MAIIIAICVILEAATNIFVSFAVRANRIRVDAARLSFTNQ